MLWAVTSYFNPFGCPARKRNYHEFRRALGDHVPLLTVETTATGVAGDLTAQDATMLVTVRGDCMWQGERGWNIALKFLPPACTGIVFVDCDVIFPVEMWKATEAGLQFVPVLQPYRTVQYLKADGSLDFSWEAAAHKPTDATFQQGVRVSHGIAWALRRDVVDRHGFYERLILGGADAGLSAAVWGREALVPGRFLMDDVRAAHYLAWAKPLSQEISGVVGCHSSFITKHLWHGSEASRQYHARKKLLVDFDPVQDVAPASISGGLVWTQTARAQMLKAGVAAYFASQVVTDTQAGS